jgi:hypothetical protein
MAILFVAKSFVKIKKLGGYPLKIQIFPKIQFFKFKFFMKREWAHSIPRQKLPQGV